MARLRSFGLRVAAALPNPALFAGACKLLLCAVTVLLSSTLVSPYITVDDHFVVLVRTATRENDLPRLRELLSTGAPEETATEIALALLTAAAENKVPALKLLLAWRTPWPVTWLKHGLWCEIRLKDLTPLMLAAKHQHREAVQLLLSHNASFPKRYVDLTDDNGRTALTWAAANGNLECARTLLDAGAYVNHLDAAGHTPLHFAAGLENVELVQLLVTAGAAVDAHGGDGFAPLHKAASADNHAVAEVLLQHGAAVDALHNGFTALHIAATGGFVDFALLLLDYGAAIDRRGSSGTEGTALEYATAFDQTAMVTALLARGASTMQMRRLMPRKARYALCAVMVAVVLLPLRLRRVCYVTFMRRGWTLTRDRNGVRVSAPRLRFQLTWLLPQYLMSATAAVWSIMSALLRLLASLARALWMVLRRLRRAPPTPPPSQALAQPPQTVRGVRRRRQQRRGTQQVAPPADMARAAGATRTEARSDDGAADEDALAAAEAAASAAAAEQAKAVAVAKQAADAAAADEAAKAAARQRALEEAAAAEEALAAAAKAARAAAEAAAAEEAAVSAARVQALEAAAVEKAAAEEAVAESVAPPPAADQRLAAPEAPLSPPSSLLKECCVCLSDLPTSELLVVAPCGHRCLCQNCWQSLEPPAARRCPICSVLATAAMRVYEAWA